jgi:hypothetical protein
MMMFFLKKFVLLYTRQMDLVQTSICRSLIHNSGDNVVVAGKLDEVRPTFYGLYKFVPPVD